MTFAELKFNLEKWRKDEFDVGRNYRKRVITRELIYIYIYIERERERAYMFVCITLIQVGGYSWRAILDFEPVAHLMAGYVSHSVAIAK